MNFQIFDDIVDAQCRKCKRVLAGKSDEYTGDSADRLIQFKTAGALQDETPIKALTGEMVKHTTKIYDYAKNPEEHTKKAWNEVITDHINYLLLLKGLLEEEA